jgi:hypothetical protein
MNSQFYKVYYEILAKSNITTVFEDGNDTASANIAPQGDYAPGDARTPKSIFGKVMFRRNKIKGVKTPKKK